MLNMTLISSLQSDQIRFVCSDITELSVLVAVATTQAPIITYAGETAFQAQAALSVQKSSLKTPADSFILEPVHRLLSRRCCVSQLERLKRLKDLDTSSQSVRTATHLQKSDLIKFQATSECSLGPVPILNKCGQYAKKVIWAGSLNKAFVR